MKNAVFGFSTTDLEQVRQALEQALGIVMVLHESMYSGEYYLWQGQESEEIQLVFNKDPLEGEPFEPEHPQLGILLYVSFGSDSYASIYPLFSSLPGIHPIEEVVS
ncbi:MAG: hypothetical protein M3441_04420 [Chloroflexota bacterium]|nr:hypothetical protein [Chloroflexota bacterium]